MISDAPFLCVLWGLLAGRKGHQIGWVGYLRKEKFGWIGCILLRDASVGFVGIVGLIFNH